MMEVSLGLISKFVRCKSIERAIAPLASQVSLFTIIIEQQSQSRINAVSNNKACEHQESLGPALGVLSCAKKIQDAVAGLVDAGKRQSSSSNDQVFKSQIDNSSATLTVASDQLLFLAQRFESGQVPDNIKQAICQNAKDILHGVLKMLLVLDDRHVRRLMETTDSVLKLIIGVDKIQNRAQLAETFKAITFAVLNLKMELRKRCQNLCSEACRDRILVWSNVLQNNIPILSKATQTFLKYRDNVSAKASRDSVKQEVVQACNKIKEFLQAGPADELDDNFINFVSVIDKVMDMLSEVNRGTLDAGLEYDLVALVEHSMAVAHFSSDVYKKLIVTSCHRILQAKLRLLELYSMLKENPSQTHILVDYDSICETMLDEVCDLEKHVNMTLLHLILETFLCPEEEALKISDLVSKLIREKGKDELASSSPCVRQFIEFTDSLCQVSLLVAASSTDSTKKREIAASVKCLESIDPEIAPAIKVVAMHPQDSAAQKHIDLLLRRWRMELRSIINAIDTMVDPRVFMDMSEQMLTQELNTLQETRGCPHKEVERLFLRFRQMAERPALLAKRLLDENSDPIYRNGLNVFIRGLFERIKEAGSVFKEIMQTRRPNDTQYDTLERRLKLIIEALKLLREGLDGNNHPHLMSDKRVLFKHRSVNYIQEKLTKAREAAAVAKAKPWARTEKTQLKEVQTQTSTKHENNHAQPPVKEGNDSTDNEESKTQEKEVVTASEERYSKDIPLPKPAEEEPEAATETQITWPQDFTEKEFEGGSAAEIYQLVKRLITACVPQDHKAVEDLTHNLLSWTNHIVENAQILSLHCSQIARGSELKTLTQEVDKLAPEVIQKAKFVAAGDKDVVHDLIKDAVPWAKKLNRARIILDVAADRWLVLTSDLRHNIERNHSHQIKVLVNAIINAQKDMCQMLLKARFLTGRHVESGPEKIEFLLDSHNEVENLAVTIRTAVEVACVSGVRTANDWWQLGMACRDWSILMTCVLSELDNISDQMETVGRARFYGLRIKDTKKDPKMADIFVEETDTILELVDCVVIGDAPLKAKSEELVEELQAALSDMLAVARQPVNQSDTPLHGLFCRVRIGLARCRWIEKAIDIQDLIRNNSYEYMGFCRQLMLNAQEIAAGENGILNESQTRQRHVLASQFLDKSQNLKQKILRAIQVCPDLSRRAVIRSTLDDLAKLTTRIDEMIRTSPSLTDGDVNFLSEQWAARMKKLVKNMKKMDGVKPAAVTEIENLNRSVPVMFQQHSLQHGLQQQQHHHLQYSHPQQQQPLSLQDVTSDTMVSEDHMQRSVAPQARATKSSYGDKSMSSPLGNSVQVVLNDARFLGFHLKKWQGDGGKESRVIKNALEMAQLCSDIAMFTRGQGTLKSSEEVIGAAVSVCRHGKELEKFARKLHNLVGEGRSADNLKACINRVNTCVSQLQIISTALHNSTKSFQGDRILMQNTSSLLMAVRQMFAVAESLAAKGFQEPASSDEETIEVITLLSKFRQDNDRYIKDEQNTNQVDELGLRRVELHAPPTLTSLFELRRSEPTIGGEPEVNSQADEASALAQEICDKGDEDDS